jgi:two-component system, chemotaxis family, protein-glutamate methylesterase/glutaminase
MVGSALDHFDARQLVCVLLTGMGNDGAEAMKRVRIAGGHTVAESEASAVVWGMPGELAKNGGAEFVQPIDEIAATVVDWVGTNANH